MRRRNLPKAPDYTNAALSMGLVNLFWIFFALWATHGLLAVLLFGVVLNWLIGRVARRE